MSYRVGDKGPGDGIVFYTEGGKYKECSGELGEYDWDTAIKMAQNFRGGGFSNWHLPNKDELDLMYQNLSLKGLGGFDTSGDTGLYWSSSEYETGYAWFQNFNSGFQANAIGNDTPCRVRAVRAF